MEILPYQNKYEAACLQLFDGNEPIYFDKSEKSPFKAYLKREKHSYWVVKVEEIIIACGGFEIEKPCDARIVWLMVSKAMHGKGIGRKLMNHFEQLIQKSGEFTVISLMTAQGVNKFYESLGYKTLRFEPKYWSERFDLYYMQKQLLTK